MESTSQGGATDTRTRVKSLLRTDLKLGEDYPLPDDAPLFGGEIDLDSLDALLLVSSLEKEFSIKVPNEAVGKDAFRSVRALAEYIDDEVARGCTENGEAPGAIDGAEALRGLPHGEAFRFISELEYLEPGVKALGRWKLQGEEPFFAGHFPGRPVVPGVLIAEALAQLSGLAGASADGAAVTAGLLVHVDVRFRRQVTPPVVLNLEAKHRRTVAALQHFEVEATVDGEPVAQGNVTLSLTDHDTQES